QGVIQVPEDAKLFGSPIAAIYTPFSFILIYEVYLLVYYLPHSITTYIGKQYEIITLIIIRRIFKDLANLELTANWFQVKDDLQFTYDLLTSLILFFLIFLFYTISHQRKGKERDESSSKKIAQFVRLKVVIAVLLVPILFLLGSYSFLYWSINQFSAGEVNGSLKDVNAIFFDEFFTLLILVDVVLLLFSLFHTDRFHTVIRNSGFIISTILLRLSFSASGLLNNVLILAAVVFGVLILLIFNQYEKSNWPEVRP
ncbi:MAG: hypothetical protein AAFU03_07920, partial [Bacteroidota bacterium]